MMPPNTGPISVPAICAVAIQPSAKPSDEPGTCEATSAVAALLKPPNIPINARAPVSSHMFSDQPIRADVIAPKMLERTTIALRPNRSASAPQIGAHSAAARKLTEPTMPDHSSTRESGWTPSCWMKSGKKRHRDRERRRADCLDPDHHPERDPPLHYSPVDATPCSSGNDGSASRSRFSLYTAKRSHSSRKNGDQRAYWRYCKFSNPSVKWALSRSRWYSGGGRRRRGTRSSDPDPLRPSSSRARASCGRG